MPGALYSWTHQGGIPNPSFETGYVALAASTSVTIDLGLGRDFVVTVSSNTPITITNPKRVPQGIPAQRISIMFRNVSGGAMGAVTWGSNYKLAAWTNPATGFSRSIEFRSDAANLLFVERSRTTVDVPN
jgi:hypothetical protein